MPILFINCSVFPFVEMILSKNKLYETRNRNTLKFLVNKKEQYEKYRKHTCVVHGSQYDFTGGTKYLYRLTKVKRCKPFTPVDGVRHGRIWMEYNGMEAYIK